MKTLKLYKTTWGGNLAYQAVVDDFIIPIHLVWMEKRNSGYALYQSSYTLLEMFSEAKTTEEAKKTMERALLTRARQYSKNKGLLLEEKIMG